MMTQSERAKQFMPFDSLKGLRKALLEREERHSRVEKHEISEELQNEISEELLKLEKGMEVLIDHHYAFHDITSSGIVYLINKQLKFLIVTDKKIFFKDIYKLQIIG